MIFFYSRNGVVRNMKLIVEWVNDDVRIYDSELWENWKKEPKTLKEHTIVETKTEYLEIKVYHSSYGYWVSEEHTTKGLWSEERLYFLPNDCVSA